MRALGDHDELVAQLCALLEPGAQRPLRVAVAVHPRGVDDVAAEADVLVEHGRAGLGLGGRQHHRADDEPRELAVQRREVAPRGRCHRCLVSHVSALFLANPKELPVDSS
jgi:hypothetical protein